jgi:hypothetical protein
MDGYPSIENTVRRSDRSRGRKTSVPVDERWRLWIKEMAASALELERQAR